MCGHVRPSDLGCSLKPPAEHEAKPKTNLNINVLMFEHGGTYE